MIECSLLGPGAVTTHLADLGADVIKIESPQGDYIREMTWPIVQGVSLLHLHVHRGKRSAVLDLRKPEAVAVFLDLVRGADVVAEAMRPGSLARRGLGFEQLREVNPKIVFCNVSGYGMTGPYQDLPAHGIAFDTWAGLVNPATDDEGFTLHPRASLDGDARRAALRRARDPGGRRCARARPEPAASSRSGNPTRRPTWTGTGSRAGRPTSAPPREVTGNKADGYERRAPGTAGMKEGVRYQIYASKDGHVLFMASEQAFWKNFCEARRSHGPVRALAGLEVRRPRARKPRAAARAARDLREPELGASGSPSGSRRTSRSRP